MKCHVLHIGGLAHGNYVQLLVDVMVIIKFRFGPIFTIKSKFEELEILNGVIFLS